MKANELMIGDWLRTSRGIVKVIAVDKIGLTFKIDGGDFDIDWDDEEEWFDAIPLTPEILEKNGFIYKKLKGVGDNEIWRIEDDYYDVDIYEWSYSIWIFRYDCAEMSLPHTQVTMSYVHELQHALRLCGIDKEITI